MSETDKRVPVEVTVENCGLAMSHIKAAMMSLREKLMEREEFSNILLKIVTQGEQLDAIYDLIVSLDRHDKFRHGLSAYLMYSQARYSFFYDEFDINDYTSRLMSASKHETLFSV